MKQRALDGPLLPLVRRLNELRRAEPALQRFDNLRLLDTHGEYVFAYYKAPDIAVAANLDRRPPGRTSSSSRRTSGSRRSSRFATSSPASATAGASGATTSDSPPAARM